MITSQDNNIENILGSRAKIKILKTLAINQIISLKEKLGTTRLNHSSVITHLNHLKILNLVQEKNFGRIKIFRYKNENLKAKSLKKFIEIWEGEY